MSSPGVGLYHGTWWGRHKDDSYDELTVGRFTELFPFLPGAEFNQDDLCLLAERMTSKQVRKPTPDPEENRAITAAYTYFGQFIDHDLTFDPTSSLREFLGPEQISKLADFRTPRFDLDNLYGRGPDDQPYMYHPDGIRMLLPSDHLSGNPDDPDAVDLPRGPNGRALIGDPRNDENRIVSQLHAIFLRFHNRVADYLAEHARPREEVSFDEVRKRVRWHYQWAVVTDFLPTIIEQPTFDRVFRDRHRPVPGLRQLRSGLRLMPVEFSVAAYRFGHSMVRPRYRLNADIEKPILTKAGGDAADLGGFRPVPSGWAIDWQLFINLEPGAKPGAGSTPRGPQHAYKIDTSLARPLGDLPDRIAKDPPPVLALRNLERGNVFGLPSGQDAARALGVDPIADEDLIIGKATANADQTPLVDIATGFAGKAPLWVYILSEAQVMSWRNAEDLPENDRPIKLGPVGSRIIADVFAALLIGDPTSYLHSDRPFKPIPEFAPNGPFGLAELINVALGRTTKPR
jgi:hypothetical protein